MNYVMTSLKDKLHWTSPQSSLRDFACLYADTLPAIVITTDGYLGFDSSLHEIGSDEIYFVFGIQRQKRIVTMAKTETETQYLSIPVDYHMKLHTFDENNRRQPAETIEDVTKTFSLGSGNMMVMFENDTSVNYHVGVDSGVSKQFGVMEVMDTYDEKYLLAYAISNTVCRTAYEIWPDMVGMPVYMPVNVVVAQGCKYGDDETFHRWMHDVKVISDRLEKQVIATGQELFLFHDLPTNGEYDYVRPTYVTIQDVAKPSSPKGNKQGKLSKSSTAQPNTYAPLPAPPPTRRPDYRGREKPTAIRLPMLPGQPQVVTELSGRQNVERSTSGGTSDKSKEDEKNRLPTSKVEQYSPANQQSADRRTTTSSGHVAAAGQQALPEYDEIGSANPNVPLGLPKKAVSGKPSARLQSSPEYEDVPSANPNETTKIVYGKPAVPLRQSTRKPSTGDESQFKKPPAPVPSTDAGQACGVNTKLTSLSESHGVDDIPADVDFSILTTADVANCLRQLNLTQFTDVFRENDVDGVLLLSLNETILQNDFGMRGIDAKRLMMFAKSGWRPKRQ